MDEQTDSGQADEPFEFTSTILPFDLPSIAGSSSIRDQPLPGTLDFDAHTLAPDQRELTFKSRFDAQSAAPPTASSADASPMGSSDLPDLPEAPQVSEMPNKDVAVEVPASEATIDLTAPADDTSTPTPMFDFDVEAPVGGGTRRGVLAMAGVACVALFMAGVAMVGGNGQSASVPPELARRDTPVVARAGVADQAFEHTISGHELDAAAVKPIISELCGQLADGTEPGAAQGDARTKLVALAPTLGETEADRILEAGVESHCIEHLFTILD